MKVWKKGARRVRIRQVDVLRGLAGLLLLGLPQGEALAQAVERNPPPMSRPAAPTGPDPAAASRPSEPIVEGPPLSGLAASSDGALQSLPAGSRASVSGGDRGDAIGTDRIRAISEGRFEDARYAYVALSLAHARALKGGVATRAVAWLTLRF